VCRESPSHPEAVLTRDLVLCGLFRVLDLRLEIRPFIAIELAAKGAVGAHKFKVAMAADLVALWHNGRITVDPGQEEVSAATHARSVAAS
jgi:hypothetical protein